MIINIDQNVFIVIVFQVLSAIALYCKKPHQLFNSDGSVKSYGTGSDQTLYPVFLVILIPSIILYVFLVSKNNEFV
jgi:hypothetical protein